MIWPLYPRTLWTTVPKNKIEQTAFTGAIMTVEQGGYSPEKNPAQTLGDVFRKTRVGARVSVEQVEADLRIKAKYIEAIEDSDAAALPSRAYTDGFLRNYATYLGMDPAEAVRRFAEENGLVSTPPRMSPVAPMPSAKKKKAAGGFASAGTAPQKSGGGSLGRIAAALGPVVLVAGLGFGGYTGYVAARDAGLIPPELGNVLTGSESEVREASSEPATDAEGRGDGDTASSAPDPNADEQGSEVEVAEVDHSKPRTDMVGSETTTGRPDSLSYARRGAVPYWQAKPPAVEPADGPVADIKPETAGLLRAGADEDEADDNAIRSSRWTARSVRENPPADVDASRIAAAAREALFGEPSAAASRESGASLEQMSVAETASTDTAPTDSAPVENDLQVATIEPQAVEPEPQFGIGPVVTATEQPFELEPAQPAQAPRRFALVAGSDTWVQVTNSLGSVTYTGILSAGEAYNIPAQEGLRLKTGNAGGLYIEVDGQRFGPLGSNGAVMRNVALNPGAVRASFTLSQAVSLSQ